jgi:two-component system response regulator YesN
MAMIRKSFNENEAGTIEDAISDISLRLHNADEIIKDNNILIANQIMLDMVRNNVADMDEVRSRFALIGIDYNYKRFIMFYTQVNLREISGLSMQERELVLYKLIDVTNSFFNKSGHCSSIHYRSDSVLHVLATDDNINMRKFSVLKAAFSKILGLKVNVTVFEATGNITDIWEQYQLVDTAKKYSFIYGYGNVFRYEDIKKYENSSHEIEFDSYKNIEDSLKLSKTDKVREEIQNVIANIKSQGYSYQYTQSTLVHITSVLFRIMRMQNMRVDDIEGKLVSFSSAETIDEFCGLIFDLLDKYDLDAGQMNSNIDLGFINKILEYIESNINADITLKSVAGHFKISHTYMSKLFKKETGVNFAVFIQDAKFKKAAQMILTDKKMSITEIANKLGYYNMTYFTRKFKERYGVTPGQYRKIHIDN